MDTELRNKWTAALRSGNYQQGRLGLHDLDNRYCCLGVLCEVLELESVRRRGGYVYYDNDQKWPTTWNVPDPVKHEIGFSADAEFTLIHLNDVQKLTFEQIAAYIDTNL